MSDLIRSTREKRGLTARALAARLGITPGGLSQIEESERLETIKLSTLRRALEAMESTPSIRVRDLDWTASATPAAIARQTVQELDRDRDSQAFRVLTDGLRQYRADPSAFSDEDLREQPPRLPRAVWDAFLRASYGEVLGDRAPRWTRVKPLPEPQYLFALPSLMNRADRDTPDYLRRIGVLVDERSLSRA